MATQGEKIVLGSGTLYCLEFSGSMPDYNTIEQEANILGRIKGGASIEYVPTYYEAKDDLGKVSKVVITEEEATLKSGIMTWNGNTLAKLSNTARVSESGGKRIVKIGGIGNDNGKKYLIHFLHEDPNDGDIRVTIVGQNQAGFTLAFVKDQETVIDAEFKAQPQDSVGTLILFVEDISELKTLTIEIEAGTTGKTKVKSITPAKAEGNSYVGKIGNEPQTVVYDQVINDWTAVTVGTTEFEATHGQVLTVAEVDSSNKAKKVGYTTIIDQIG